MSSYFVYIVRCADETLYTGITTDIVRRLSEHRSQAAPAAKYTRVHSVVELVALWTAPDRSAASKLEYRIKQLDRNAKDHLVFYPHTVSKLFPEDEALANAFAPVDEDALRRFWEESGEGRKQ